MLEQNGEIVRHVYEAMNARDLDVLETLDAPG
jgi:hypothetical protein